MKVYTLHKEQNLPISLEEAWDFFSAPANLARITPPYMGFHIKYISGGDKMYAGQIIRYKIQVIKGVNRDWTTEITHVEPYQYFIDEQRFGPYSLWHHQHHFSKTNEGIKMTDIVNYALPFGLIGNLAHVLFVKKQVHSIFEFRSKVLEKLFTR